jgi:hypothetical protein
MVAVGTLAASALASHGGPADGRVVPFAHCADGTHTVHAGQELYIRYGWGTSAPGQADKFINAQRATWSISDSSGTLNSSTPTSFGDLTYWTGPTYVPDALIDGIKRKSYFWWYYGYTGVILAAGESVTLDFTLEVSSPLNDGFGYSTPVGVVTDTQDCVITAVAP